MEKLNETDNQQNIQSSQQDIANSKVLGFSRLKNIDDKNEIEQIKIEFQDGVDVNNIAVVVEIKNKRILFDFLKNKSFAEIFFAQIKVLQKNNLYLNTWTNESKNDIYTLGAKVHIHAISKKQTLSILKTIQNSELKMKYNFTFQEKNVENACQKDGIDYSGDKAKNYLPPIKLTEEIKQNAKGESTVTIRLEQNIKNIKNDVLSVVVGKLQKDKINFQIKGTSLNGVYTNIELLFEGISIDRHQANVNFANKALEKSNINSITLDTKNDVLSVVARFKSALQNYAAEEGINVEFNDDIKEEIKEEINGIKKEAKSACCSIF